MVSSANKGNSRRRKNVAVRPTRQELKKRTVELLEQEIQFIDNTEFRELDHVALRAEGSELLRRIDAPVELTASKSIPPPINSLCSQPLLQKEDEREVFRIMNFFKFRANSLRSCLDASRPSIRKLREIESCLQLANELRNCAARSNTRLVVSIVKKFVNDQNDFEELVSEGLTCLLRVVDKFDYGRGFRFSTYATWSLKNWMLRIRQRSQHHADRFKTGLEGVSWEDSRIEEDLQVEAVADREVSDILKAAMGVLNDRERLIIESRCGFRSLDLGAKPTLKNLGEMLGVCKERIRQIERRGMDKIREQLDEMNVNFEWAFE